MKKEKNIRKFGVLYGETNYLKHKGRKNVSQFFMSIFLLRRLSYTLVILFIYKWPNTQQIVNITVHGVALIYELINRPYSMRTLLGILIYFLDFVAFIIFATLPLYLNPSNNADKIGRFHIYLIVITFGLSWIAVIYEILHELYIRYKKPTERVKINIAAYST